MAGVDPYTTDDLGSPSVDRLGTHLGLKPTPQLTRLGRELAADIDVDAGGFGWWTTTPIRARILISDLAVNAQQSIAVSLVEAAVAEQRAGACLEHDTTRWRAHGEKGQGFGFPPPEHPYDDIAEVEERLAVDAELSALARSLDLAAAVAITVFDLPMNLRRADWSALRKNLATKSGAGWLENAITDAGPDGWHEWFLDLRNSITHRPRSLTLRQVKIDGVRLHLPDERHFDRLRVVSHLPAHPNLSYVEAFTSGPRAVSEYLTESSLVTLLRLRLAVTTLLETVSERLCQHWLERRANGRGQLQHAKQWRSATSSRFAGFANGSEPFDTDFMMLHPSEADRLRAAHLMDDQRPRTWGDDEA